jgi:hypothetical protein
MPGGREVEVRPLGHRLRRLVTAAGFDLGRGAQPRELSLGASELVEDVPQGSLGDGEPPAEIVVKGAGQGVGVGLSSHRRE